MAYCLLGIFDVQLPLLYGERDAAFIRLQREIFSRTGDETIFTWLDPRKYTGRLAMRNTHLAFSPGVRDVSSIISQCQSYQIQRRDTATYKLWSRDTYRSEQTYPGRLLLHEDPKFVRLLLAVLDPSAPDYDEQRDWAVKYLYLHRNRLWSLWTHRLSKWS